MSYLRARISCDLFFSLFSGYDATTQCPLWSTGLTLLSVWNKPKKLIITSKTGHLGESEGGIYFLSSVVWTRTSEHFQNATSKSENVALVLWLGLPPTSRKRSFSNPFSKTLFKPELRVCVLVWIENYNITTIIWFPSLGCHATGERYVTSPPPPKKKLVISLTEFSNSFGAVWTRPGTNASVITYLEFRLKARHFGFFVHFNHTSQRYSQVMRVDLCVATLNGF